MIGAWDAVKGKKKLKRHCQKLYPAITRVSGTGLKWFWAIVDDAGPTSFQHCFNVSHLLGCSEAGGLIPTHEILLRGAMILPS